MNSLSDNPNKKEDAVLKPSKEKKKDLPTDRKILDTLYNHYGKPKNIVKEKVKLYTGYRSPAGTPQPDWKAGDFQLGRVTVFTGVKDNPSDLYERTKIGDEGEATWFIGVTDSHIKVWIGGSVDTTLEIESI